MSKLKAILIAIVLLIPALIAASILTGILIAIDYGPDPGREIGITLWGVWCLLCGFYFKSSRFKIAGIALLGFAALGLLLLN